RTTIGPSREPPSSASGRPLPIYDQRQKDLRRPPRRATRATECRRTTSPKRSQRGRSLQVGGGSELRHRSLPLAATSAGVDSPFAHISHRSGTARHNPNPRLESAPRLRETSTASSFDMFSVLCIPLFASLAVATPGQAIEPTRPASIAAAAETLTVSTTWLAEHLHDPNVV